MIRRVLVSGLACLVVVGNLPAQAATPKPGAACPKLGQIKTVSGKKYTCVSKNKKLVWSSPVALKPIVAPKPTPTVAPVVPYVQRWRTLDSRALVVFERWRANTVLMPPQHSVALTYVKSDKVADDVVEEIKKRYDFAARFWEQHQKTLLPLRIFLGGGSEVTWTCKESRAWLKSNQPLEECEAIQRGNLVNGFMAGQGQLRDRKVDVYTVPNIKVLFEQESIPRVEHEYTHSVFYEQSWQYQEQVPCWLTEGGAEFFGTLISTSDNAARYLDLRNSRILRANGPARNGTSELTDWLAFVNRADRSDLIGRSGDPCLEVRSEIYQHAILPVEYLVDRLGIPGLLALIREASRSSWASAVQGALGKPKADVYADIAAYAKKEFDLVQANRWSTGYCLFNAKEPVCAP